MREIRVLGPKERREVYDRYYKEAFPPAELRPFASMEKLAAAGAYRTLGLYEGREALAYASVWRDGRYVLIDYLCVPPEKRSGGLGGELLRRLREAFPPDCVLFGESEAPTGNQEKDALILRRLGFYARCGAKALPYDVWLFGVHYKALGWYGEGEDIPALMARHAGFYRRSMPKALYEKMIKIPYAEAKHK